MRQETVPNSFDWLSLLCESPTPYDIPMSHANSSPAIFEHISDAFIVLDLDGRFLFLNGHAEQLLHQSRAALIGQSAWDIFPDVRDTDMYAAYQLSLIHI